MSALPRPDRPLEDDVVALRQVSMEHAEAIAAACVDPEIPAWTSVPRDYTLDHAREWLARVETATESIHLGVFERESGRLAGVLSLWIVKPLVGEFGYWTAKELRGRGYMTRALQLLSRWALEEAGLARLQLGTLPGNRSSERVAEKVGYRREGVLRSYFDQRGEQRRDVTMWSLLPGELR
jgi:RimJ/RimL family protein N-acetyltransferase